MCAIVVRKGIIRMRELLVWSYPSFVRFLTRFDGAVRNVIGIVCLGVGFAMIASVSILG